MSNKLDITSPEIALIWAATELAIAWAHDAKVSPTDIATAFLTIYAHIRAEILPK